MTEPEITIYQPRLENRNDSFFYDGLIADCMLPDGTLLRLEAQGDSLIFLDEGCPGFGLRRGTLQQLQETALTDAILSRNAVTWENNNWFAIEIKTADSDEWRGGDDDLGTDYDQAFEAFRQMVKELMGVTV